MLVRPDVQYRESFLTGLSEMTSASERSAWIYLGDDSKFNPSKDFDLYVATLLAHENDPPAGFVCDSTYWALAGSEVVGRIALRHELNEFLGRIGGHIGYIVRPTARGQGVATAMLAEVLKMPRAKSMGRLLLTCDATNVASRKTIESNGGEFESEIDMGAGRSKKLRFWITIA